MAARRQKTSRKKAPGRREPGVAAANRRQDTVALEQIRDAASEVHRRILEKDKPDLSFPVR